MVAERLKNQRLNLPLHLCTRIVISTYLELNGLEESLAESIYGVSYRRSKTPHVFTAFLHESTTDDRYHIHLDYQVADWGKAPKSIRNPDLLWELIGKLEEPLDFETRATFVYPEHLWNAVLTLPYAYPKEDAPSDLTHMEGITFSRRVGDDLEYSITLAPPDSSEIRHSVIVHHTNLYSIDLPQNLLERCQDVSLLMITPKDGEDYAS